MFELDDIILYIRIILEIGSFLIIFCGVIKFIDINSEIDRKVQKKV